MYGMPESISLTLDGSSWLTKDDVYASLLGALQAPGWHGHNLDALEESLSEGGINGINPPLMITFSGSQHMGPEALAAARRIVELCDRLAEEGIAVDAALAIGPPDLDADED